MESNVSKFTEQLEKIAQLFNRTLRRILAITFVDLAGIVCYAIFCHDKSICFGVVVLGCGTLVAICALCWLGCCCKQLLEIYFDSRKQLSDTELSLYRENVRREGMIHDKQMAIIHQDPDIVAKHREIKLVKLEKELQALK